MSIDFSTLQGLTIPEGVVTQIADASGNVLWAMNTGSPIVLEVAKITSDTYVSSTAYTDEQFVLLKIYPKTSSSTVKVTYGDLTKTLAFSSTDTQEVYFGTYGGVADSVSTPASGTLTIEGGCVGVAVASYNTAKNSTDYCGCITAITGWGEITEIPKYAFYCCKSLTSVSIPDSVTSIGTYAFASTGLTSVSIPDSVTSIGTYAFAYNTSLTRATIGDGITDISTAAFYKCYSLTSITISDSVTTISSNAFNDCYSLTNVTIPKNVQYFGSGAFYLNKDYATLEFSTIFIMLPTTPPEVYIDAAGNFLVFGNYTDNFWNRKFIVPAGCGATYKAAEGWSDFADCITEAN